METVATLLAHAAQRSPDAPAIFAPDAEVLSYSELVREVRRFVGWLRSHDVAPGDRVAWVAPNGPHAASGTRLQRTLPGVTPGVTRVTVAPTSPSASVIATSSPRATPAESCTIRPSAAVTIA